MLFQKYIRFKIKKRDLLVFLCFVPFVPLYLYNLGGFSLVDFDEAWFAEVARNILVNKNPLVLTFNNDRFIEHPPSGFVLMALSFLVFGINEFSARFFSAFLGLAAVYILYLIGKHWFNRTIGMGASLMFTSCVWYVFRARSANLDTIFVFFFLLSIYAATKVKKDSNWIYLVSFSLAATLLAKTLVGMVVLLPIMMIFIQSKPRIEIKKFIKALLLLIVLVGSWILANYLQHGPYFLYHILYVGLRPFARVMPNFRDLGSALTFQYLHFGIRKWYYPAIISLVGSVFWIIKNKKLLIIYAIIIAFLTGFLTNEKTEIWHIIPLYPFFGLLISFFLYHLVLIGMRLLRLLGLFPQKSMDMTTTVTLLTLLAFVFASVYQIYLFRYEVKLFDKDTAGLAYTARKARNRSEKLYLYADYFLPSAVFYSQKQVFMVASQEHPLNTLVGIINQGTKPYLLLGEKWKFAADQISPENYKSIAEHKEYILVLVD